MYRKWVICLLLIFGVKAELVYAVEDGVIEPLKQQQTLDEGVATPNQLRELLHYELSCSIICSSI